jgi:hypothetical protein
MWQFLTNWITVVAVVPVLITLGWGALSMNPPSFTSAHSCFSLAATILLVRLGWMLAFEQPGNTIQKVIFAFVTFGLIGSLWLYCIQWVNEREQMFKETLKPPTITGPTFRGKGEAVLSAYTNLPKANAVAPRIAHL